MQSMDQEHAHLEVCKDKYNPKSKTEGWAISTASLAVFSDRQSNAPGPSNRDVSWMFPTAPLHVEAQDSACPGESRGDPKAREKSMHDLRKARAHQRQCGGIGRGKHRHPSGRIRRDICGGWAEVDIVAGRAARNIAYHNAAITVPDPKDSGRRTSRPLGSKLESPILPRRRKLPDRPLRENAAGTICRHRMCLRGPRVD